MCLYCRLRITELDQGVSVWQESPIAALNSWYSLYPDPRGWRTCIPSAIAFLSGAFPEQVATTWKFRESGFEPTEV